MGFCNFHSVLTCLAHFTLAEALWGIQSKLCLYFYDMAQKARDKLEVTE